MRHYSLFVVLLLGLTGPITAQSLTNLSNALGRGSAKPDAARPNAARPNRSDESAAKRSPTERSPTEPVRRSDSPIRRYFGLHFDFHADTSDAAVGRTLSERRLDSLLSAVQPDFIQVDCKGHPGVTSYPSKVANATTVKSFVRDPLQFYRAVTKKHGVALYLHYSGIQDYAILRKHPDWGVVKADGSLDNANTSVHGPYVDSLMIPQLKEVADYGADGVWVDGDCWATKVDYSPAAVAAFRAETGIHNVPKLGKEPMAAPADYEAFRNFARRSFLRYVGHYADALHRHNSNFRVASNWAYSSMMPEPIQTNVDYLSGDLAPVASFNSAALEARILAPQGRMYHKPWDLMSWSFWYDRMGGDQKTAVQLMQEAAQVIAHGGGFQGYFHQNRDASLDFGELPAMTALARFVRARQPFCQGVVPVPQIAVLYSNTTLKRVDRELFSRDQMYRVQGVLTALLDNQLPCEVLAEHHLTGRMAQYPIIVVSQQDTLAPAFRRELVDYARQGGTLVLIGVGTTKNFAPELGVTPTGPATTRTQTVHYNGTSVVLNGLFQSVKVTGAAKPFGQMGRSDPGEPSAGVAATTTAFGRGRLIGIYADLSRDYEKHQSSKQRDFVGALVRPLLPNPVVTVLGSHLVHVVVNRLAGTLAVNLINTGGRHADPQVFTYDEVLPLPDLTVQIRTGQKPRRIIQQPENRVLPMQWAGGIATVTVPQVVLHSILMVE